MEIKAVAALILGLLGTLFSWVPIVGLVLGVIGLVLAVGATQKGGFMPYAALSLSIVASVVSFVFLLGTLIRIALL